MTPRGQDSGKDVARGVVPVAIAARAERWRSSCPLTRLTVISAPGRYAAVSGVTYQRMRAVEQRAAASSHHVARVGSRSVYVQLVVNG